MAQMQATEGLQARMKSDDEYSHGRAPFGLRKDDKGHLNQAAKYDHVSAVLDMVQNGELSKRKAAAELNTSRKTIDRSLDDRPELYGLAEA